MRRLVSRCCPVICLLATAFALPAIAEVHVLETQGLLSHWVLYDGRHSPCSIIYWSHLPEDGVGFDAQAVSWEDACVPSAWNLRCDENGVLFNGWLTPDADGAFEWWVYLELDLEVVLEVTAPTRISAGRAAEGIFAPELHTVSLTRPDGSTEILLGGETGVDQVERLVEPGTYRISCSALVDDYWYLPFEYSGLVEVNWSGPVGRDVHAWDEVKSLFR